MTMQFIFKAGCQHRHLTRGLYLVGKSRFAKNRSEILFKENHRGSTTIKCLSNKVRGKLLHAGSSANLFTDNVVVHSMKCKEWVAG